MNEQKFVDLLKNKVKLLSLVPTHAYDPNYSILLKQFPTWYQVVMGLSENLSNSKKRAKKFGWKCDLDLPYLTELWMAQSGKCSLTGQWLDHASGSLDNKNPYRASVDRIDNSKGYVKGNVRLLTHWANNAKSTWADTIFETFVKTSNQVLTENA
jgi:hypothetical protein